MKTPFPCLMTIFGATLVLAVVGCEKSATSGSSAKSPTAANASAPPATAEGLPSAVWLTAEPAGAKPVAEVRTAAEAGQEVVVIGRIAGQTEPFVAGRAIFMLADRSIPSCTEKHGPGCRTPWDFCCEAKETVRAGTATVQIVGPDGKPLKIGLENQRGLKPLADVVIAGKVSTAGDALVIDATGIYVKP